MATVAITPDQDVVTAEIFIAAPPARVFQAITDPRQVPQWWGQKEMYRVTDFESDLRVNGKWKSTGVGANGDSFQVSGEYLEVDPPRLLVQTWTSSYGGDLKPPCAGNLNRKACMACTRAVRNAPVPARS